MLTTQSALRLALQETQKPTGTLPPFALPKGVQGYQEVSPKVALTELIGSRAGFVGKNVAALVHKVF